MYISTMTTGIGRLWLGVDDKALLRVSFTPLEGKHKETAVLKQAKAEIAEYMNGTRQNFTVPTKLVGTEFQIKVWNILRQIPYGKVWSYKQVAEIQGKVIDLPAWAIQEKATFDTRIVFKGAAPSLVVPADASQEKRGDLDFYGLVILGFELPATPYAAAPLRSGVRIRFNDDCRYEFDFSKVAKTSSWTEYPLAEATGSGTLVISNAELARLSGVVADAAKPFGLKAKVVKSADGKKLIASFRKIGGFMLSVR